jgi:hypothetical protein
VSDSALATLCEQLIQNLESFVSKHPQNELTSRRPETRGSSTRRKIVALR